jgi:hypothetical protein
VVGRAGRGREAQQVAAGDLDGLVADLRPSAIKSASLPISLCIDIHTIGWKTG